MPDIVTGYKRNNNTLTSWNAEAWVPGEHKPNVYARQTGLATSGPGFALVSGENLIMTWEQSGRFVFRKAIEAPDVSVSFDSTEIENVVYAIIANNIPTGEPDGDEVELFNEYLAGKIEMEPWHPARVHP